MNIFNLASNDQSVYYLGFIFGTVGDVLSPATGGSTTVGLIGTMLKFLNVTALAIGVFVVVYITIVGILATAHEGQFLGKDWSGLWVPLKMVLGVVALIPTGPGYSLIQIFIMWIVVQGVAAADSLWTTVLQYLQYTGSPYATVTVPSTDVNAKLRTLFQGATCQATLRYANNLAGNPNTSSNGYYYYCNETQTNPWCARNFNDLYTLPNSKTATTYYMGPGGACGQVNYCSEAASCTTSTSDSSVGPNSLKCLECIAQKGALQAVLSGFGQISQSFVEADSQYLQFYGSGMRAVGGSFIQNYCSGSTPPISSQNCCYYRGRSGLSGLPLPCNTSQDSFPDSCADTSGGGCTNASTNAAKNLYWPYVTLPLISGGSGKNADFITMATSAYTGALAGAFTTWIMTNPQKLDDWRADAQNNGWLLAGAYYYKIAEGNNDNNNLAVNIPFEVSIPQPPGENSPLKVYRNNINAANDLLGALDQASSQGNGFSSMLANNPQLSGLGSAFSTTASSLVNNFMNTVSSGKVSNKDSSFSSINTNVLSSVQHLGQSLIDSAEALFTTFFVVTMVIVWTVGGWEPFVLGTGLHTPGSTFVLGYILIFLPILFAILAFLFTMGALLGVYTPLIPFIIYSIGALTWFIGVIEAMVAGPLIALAIIAPGKGGHEILGRAEPALMGMFNLFLRPSLMVFGMIAAMFLSAVAVSMVNSAFAGVVGQIGGAAPPISMMIFFLAAYVGLILSILNKCFSLIHVIPDKVLTWVGGHHIPGGSADATEALRGTQEKVGAAGAAAGAAGAKTMGTGKLGTAAAKDMKANTKDADPGVTGGSS